MMMKKFLKAIFVLTLLAVFLYSGLQVYRIYSAYARAKAQYSDLTQYVVTPTLPPVQEAEPPSQTIVVPPSVQPEPEHEQPAPIPEVVEEILWPQVDFEALRAINPDIVGWLTIEGTGIHYPVVQGQDNDFYLTHQFDKSTSRAGCLFVDVANDAAFSDPNTIIYGHYTKDRSMFYELRGYKQQDFFDAHPTGWLITPSTIYKLHFFSGYVSDIYGDAWDTDFIEKDYAEWLNTRKKKSVFTAEVLPQDGDQVLTLSTCSYEFENARFVLHAILEEQSVSAAGNGRIDY